MESGKNSQKAPQQMKEEWQQVAGEVNFCRGPTRSAKKLKVVTFFILVNVVIFENYFVCLCVFI